MMKKTTLKPLTAALGTTFAVTLAASPLAGATDNPFAASAFEAGYMVADSHGGGEGKCGEGKCGAEGAKAGEGKCGEGKCGAEGAKAGEGKCGEGKCGAEGAKAGEGKCGAAGGGN